MFIMAKNAPGSSCTENAWILPALPQIRIRRTEQILARSVLLHRAKLTKFRALFVTTIGDARSYVSRENAT